MKNAKFKRTQTAFTLVEMAIVLALIGLILGTGLTVLSVQQEQRKIEETNALLSDARDALIGFAIANGRLPCPASSTSNGYEDPIGGGVCTHPYDGFVPAKTLALGGTDRAGYFTDSWKNPIRYAVTTSNSNVFTTVNGMSTSGISSLVPDLQVCSTTTGITGTPPATTCASGPPSTSLASGGVPAVIYSTGANMVGLPGSTGGTGGTGSDEAANPNPNSTTTVDRLFISHAFSSANETGGYFDDQVTWLSQYILFNRMVQAGKLP